MKKTWIALLCLLILALPMGALAEDVEAEAVEAAAIELEGELLTGDMEAAPQPESAVMAAADGDQAADGLPITKAAFPDEAFRRYILETIDTDGDGNLSQAEIRAVSRINLPADVVDAKGISTFTRVKGISAEWGGKLKKLPLGKLSRLEWLSVSGNKLSSLDISGCPKLKELTASENRLKKLDVSKNKNLVELNVHYNRLTSIDVRNNAKLKTLCVRCNSGLKKLDVSKNTKLKILLCGYTAVKKVDIANCPKLLAVMKQDRLPHALTSEKKYTGGSIAWTGDPWESSDSVELPVKAKLYNGKKLLYKAGTPKKQEFYVVKYDTGKKVKIKNGKMTAKGDYYLRVKMTPAYAAKPLTLKFGNNSDDSLGYYQDNNGYFGSQEPGSPTIKVYMGSKKVYTLKVTVK